jgi:hypothetical protein
LTNTHTHIHTYIHAHTTPPCSQVAALGEDSNAVAPLVQRRMFQSYTFRLKVFTDMYQEAARKKVRGLRAGSCLGVATRAHGGTHVVLVGVCICR